jgi:predicted transcriptional regulator
MATTSLKLPDDLKARAQAAAENQGISPHAFMVQAIEQAISSAEIEEHFLADAYAAREESHRTGLVFAAEDVHDYIRSVARGENPPLPQAQPWQK